MPFFPLDFLQERTGLLAENAMRATIYKGFDDLPAVHQDFLAGVEANDFFAGLGWYRNFAANAVEPSAQVRIYAVEEGVKGVRAILFARTPAGQNGSIFANRFPGWPTLASLTNYQSIRFSLVLAEGEYDKEKTVGALARTICAEKPRLGVLDFNLMDPESSSFSLLRAAFTKAGMVVRTYEYNRTVFEKVAGSSYEEFLASRSEIVKKTFVRKARNLAKRGSTEFKMITTAQDAEAGLQDYQTVLENSWKEPEPFPRHTPGVVRAAALSGALRLGILYFDGQPVAAQIWIVSGGRATIYKLHYDLSHKQLSVGSILSLRMFETVIDRDRVSEIDFGVGGEPHKLNWLSQSRSLQGIVAFNPRTAIGLRQLILYTLRTVWRRTRRSLRDLRTRGSS